VGYVACIGKLRNAYKPLVRKPEGKRQLGSHSCMWEDNIKMGIREIVFGVWVGLIRFR
jgi:hypothetical protein